MICKLTGKEGTPAKAHIIPESFYLIDKCSKQPSKLVTNTKGVYPKKSWSGIYDKTIVTREGEKIFLEWDDYAYKLLVEQFSAAKPIKHNNLIIAYVYDNYDYKRLKLFFLSLLWRASVSSHQFFKRVSLDPHAEIVKEAILKSNPGAGDFYATLLSIFNDDQSWAKMMDPFSTRHDGIKFYKFYLGNIVADIKVDKRSALSPLKEFQISPKHPLILFTRNFWGSKENEVMKKILVLQNT
jgi:hypothetical protein